MGTLFRLLVVAGLAAAAAGCAISPLTSDDPYPVYGNPVNPTPAPGYRVVCRSAPDLGYPLFDNFTTACRQVIVPRYRGDVVTTKG